METLPLKALWESFVKILLVSWKNWFYLYLERLSGILTEVNFHLTWSRAQFYYNFYSTFVNKWDFSRHLISVFNVCILERQMFYEMADLFASLLFNVILFLLGGWRSTQQKRAEMHSCSGKWPSIPRPGFHSKRKYFVISQTLHPVAPPATVFRTPSLMSAPSKGHKVSELKIKGRK